MGEMARRSVARCGFQRLVGGEPSVLETRNLRLELALAAGQAGNRGGALARIQRGIGERGAQLRALGLERGELGLDAFRLVLQWGEACALVGTVAPRVAPVSPPAASAAAGTGAPARTSRA